MPTLIAGSVFLGTDCDVDAAVVFLHLSFRERIAGSTCVLGTLASCQLRVVASV